MDAEYMALMQSSDETLDLYANAVRVADLLKVRAANEHVKRGIGRRLSMLHMSVSIVWQSTPPERTEPTKDHEEQTALNIHINSIYTNIRGITDNAAWALALEHGILNPTLPTEDDFGEQASHHSMAKQVVR